MIMMKDVQVIGFDADDTLWVNEPYFYDTTRRFCRMMSRFASCEEVEQMLYRTEVGNIRLYGYGAKSFILSMVETALNISNNQVDATTIGQVIDLGKELISKPVELIEGVPEVLKALCRYNYRLIVATKGDLQDQERKLKKSGLQDYFHHIEIMSDKQEADYQKLLKNLDVDPRHFMMVGNSLKSDILPVLNLGAYGIHIPFHTTWKHEEIDVSGLPQEGFIQLNDISEITGVLNGADQR